MTTNGEPKEREQAAEPEPPAGAGRSGRRWLAAVLAVALAAGAAAALWRLGWGAGDLPEGLLYANGRLEAVDVRVSAEVTGRVVESHLVEGARVERGDLLVRLDDAELAATLAEARARREALERVRERLGHEIRTWRHHARTASDELQRQRELERAGAASEQRLDRAEDAHEEAQGRVAALEAQRRETEARIAAAENEIELFEIRLAKTSIRAPIGGTVLVRGIEVGELAAPGRLVAELADLSALDLRVFVPEREIAKVKLRAPARVRVDAFPRRAFAARVERVDPEAQFTPREVHMPEERVRMVFGVVLRVPNPEGFLKPGMPADAWIRWRDDAPWPDPLPVPR